MRRIRRLVCLALAATALVLPVAQPAAARSSKTVDIAGTRYADDGWFFFPQSCGPTQSGLCAAKGSGIVHWSGAFNGISEYTVYVWWDNAKQKIIEDNWERFTVNISGCGSGAFLTHQHKEVTPGDVLSYQDPASGQIQGGEGSWRYVSGTATGALAKMSSFWFTIKHVAFDPVTFANRGALDAGTARC